MRSLLITGLCLLSVGLRAQNSGETTAKWQHTISVQINPLLRQLFSFGDVEADNTPFLMNYHLNSAKHGWGARVGVGLNYLEVKDNDGITARNTGQTQYAIRLGAERKIDLGKRWEVGYGLDAVMQRDENNTTTVVSSFDTITTVSRNSITQLGGGAMVWIRFRLSERILIGTESSVYYQTGTLRENIEVTRRNFSIPGAPQTTTKNTFNTTLTELPFRVPISVFLAIRF